MAKRPKKKREERKWFEAKPGDLILIPVDKDGISLWGSWEIDDREMFINDPDHDSHYNGTEIQSDIIAIVLEKKEFYTKYSDPIEPGYKIITNFGKVGWIGASLCKEVINASG